MGREILTQARPRLGLHVIVVTGIVDLIAVGVPWPETKEGECSLHSLLRSLKEVLTLQDEYLLPREQLQPALQLFGVVAPLEVGDVRHRAPIPIRRCLVLQPLRL